MKKYTATQIKEICRLQHIHNNHNFAQGNVYIHYTTGDNGRMAHYPFWSVFKQGVNLGTASWLDNGAKQISVSSRAEKEPKFQEAKDFAKEKFGITEWARGPFGAWYDKSFVEKRMAEIIRKHEDEKTSTPTP